MEFCLYGELLSFITFFSLKTHRQISKKRYFEKCCSCDKACQFLALQSIPWRSYLENLTIDEIFMNKQVRLFIHQTMKKY